MQEISLLSKPDTCADLFFSVYVGDEISWSAIMGTVHPKVD
jgi:hypothetical protein